MNYHLYYKKNIFLCVFNLLECNWQLNKYKLTTNKYVTNFLNITTQKTSKLVQIIFFAKDAVICVLFKSFLTLFLYQRRDGSKTGI